MFFTEQRTRIISTAIPVIPPVRFDRRDNRFHFLSVNPLFTLLRTIYYSTTIVFTMREVIFNDHNQRSFLFHGGEHDEKRV